jgi:hypothetical protein
MIFAKAGLVTPAAALSSALAAHAVSAAPARLIASLTAAAMKSASAHSAFSFAAWMQGKAAILGGAAILLAAAGIVTITVKAVNTPVADIAGQLEKQSGEIVVCENRLDLPVTFNVKGLTLPEALDRLATRAGAYWTVDYAIYDSKSALESLEEGLRQAAQLESVGWTNLSHRLHTITPMMVPHAPGMRFNMALRLMPDKHSDDVTMMVDLGPDASVKWIQRPRADLPPGRDAEDSDEYKTLVQSMKDGESEGVLVPQRLLAEKALLPRITVAPPVEATAENAALIAKKAGAHWATIYTLRRSPLDGCGIRLIHAGMEDAYGQSKPTRRFDLSPDDRDAHEQAVDAYLHKKASNSP